MDGSINALMDGWMDRLIDGWMDEWMDEWIDGWIDQMIYESMDRWTVHRHPSPIFFDPPGHHWLYRKQYLPPSKVYRQRGLSLLRIRIGCPTGILFFFVMEEFVREGGRHLPIRAERNNDLM